MELDYSFIRVPYECAVGCFRQSQKKLTKEINTLKSEVELLLASNEEAKQVELKLAEMLNNLTDLKKQLAKQSAEQRKYLQQCLLRLTHLQQQEEGQKEQKRMEIDQDEKIPNQNGVKSKHQFDLEGAHQVSEYEMKQHSRLIGDYLLHEGYFDTAKYLQKTSGLEGFLDIEVFENGYRIMEDLRKHQTDTVLEWCRANAPRLRRLESSFEFNIRVQEFVELVRKGAGVEAIYYAQNHLSPYAESQAETFQVAMATLSCTDPENTPVESYRTLFSPTRWDKLCDDFFETFRKVYSISNNSPMIIALQAGLSVLRTRRCESHSKDSDLCCPTCTKNGYILSQKLPYSHIAHSRLICPLTKKLMNENNSPMVLPNGQVYSKEAITMITDDSNIVQCIKTGDTFNSIDIQPLYII